MNALAARHELEQAEAALVSALAHLDRAHAALDGDAFLAPPATALRGDVGWTLRRCKALSAHVRAHSPAVAGTARSGG